MTRRHHRRDMRSRRKAQQPGPNKEVLDADGLPIRKGACEILQVAHILPHSLMTRSGPAPSQVRPRTPSRASRRQSASSRADTDGGAETPASSQLDEKKVVTIALLQMFCPTVLDLIDGSLIDSPRNAFTLCEKAHGLFGEFLIWFAPTPGSEIGDNRYTVLATDDEAVEWLEDVIKERGVPNDCVVNTEEGFGFNLTFASTLDCPAPSWHLLRIHAAIAMVLRLSAAGYVDDDIQDDLEDIRVPTNDSANFGPPESLGIMSWLESVFENQLPVG